MKVFLGNAPWYTPDRFGVRAGSRWPFTMPRGPHDRVPFYVPFPFFLAYAAALLQRAGHEVLLVDAIAEGISTTGFLERVAEFVPDLVLLETSTPTIRVDLMQAQAIRERLGGKMRLFLAGPHASCFATDLIAGHSFLDGVIVGEYEWTLVALADCLAAGIAPAAVPNLVLRESGRPVSTVTKDCQRPLAEYPRPAYAFLPMYNYNDDFGVLQFPNVQVATSRGCPYRCGFCLWPQVLYGNNRCRFRDPVDVADEIEWLVTTYGFRSVYFDDDTFNLRPERLRLLCREMRIRGLGVTWAGMARADHLDEATVAAMAAAGCVALKFGVESASQEIVDRCGKQLALAAVDRAIALCHHHGISVHLTFTFGLPGETQATAENTIAYALAAGVASVQFSIVTPFPGTRLFAELQAQGKLAWRDWDDFDGSRRAVVRTDELSSADLETCLATAHRRWQEHRAGRMP